MSAVALIMSMEHQLHYIPGNPLGTELLCLHLSEHGDYYTTVARFDEEAKMLGIKADRDQISVEIIALCGGDETVVADIKDKLDQVRPDIRDWLLACRPFNRIPA